MYSKIWLIQFNFFNWYKFYIIQGKSFEKIELEAMQQKIKEFYKLFPKFDFKSIYDNDNPIMYITYLSHMKEKLKWYNNNAYTIKYKVLKY